MQIDERPRQPIADYWDWQFFAACRGMDIEVFFHPFEERRNKKAQRINQAKSVCQTCPVVTECRNYALQTVEPYGIWGGLSEEERARILGRRILRHPGPRQPGTPR